ncbi:DUF547 domain-containing protein [Formosa maritima]|uniref:DUF547 domain-containing protein n=1 Tax=Formosa maritima TaxID=2592046 RepID=A0A5D0G385_9FLAO|nr:DUF547 domain-containing protein [Formosa maritima]TYA53110.1 DUF547 domain-containing protein [Formosa maritima]
MTFKIYSLFIFFICLGVFQSTNAQALQFNSWNEFLQKHVNNSGDVNYKSIIKNQRLLLNSLNDFSKNQPNNSWSKEEKLAYWINAYNAFTIKLIIDKYPIKSIKDIKKPWEEKFIPIEKQLMSLNEIEHNILRKLDEPRIHFAIVCASKSCPKLLNEAYTPSKLDHQLTIATEEFLSDNTKNNVSEDNIKLSKIFKWFSEDFTQNGSLIDFLNQYSKIEISPKANRSFLDYNWDLNE